MIKVTVYKDNKDLYRGFHFIGHAEYDDIGEDVVCSGVSALVITTINSLEMLTDAVFDMDSDAELGEVKVTFTKDLSKDAQLLLKSLIIGVQGIADEYGTDYVRLLFEEV